MTAPSKTSLLSTSGLPGVCLRGTGRRNRRLLHGWCEHHAGEPQNMGKRTKELVYWLKGEGITRQCSTWRGKCMEIQSTATPTSAPRVRYETKRPSGTTEVTKRARQRKNLSCCSTLQAETTSSKTSKRLSKHPPNPAQMRVLSGRLSNTSELSRTSSQGTAVHTRS